VQGVDPAIRAMPGQSRAGVIRAGSDAAPALIDGIGAEARAGDIKLWNDRVQFVVQGAYRSHGWVDVGGTIIDADLVRPEGEPGYDMVDDIFLSFGPARLFEADAVEVVADGTFGGPAIVRATGSDVVWDFFDAGLELEQPLLGDLGLAITTEYFLPPDSYSMRVTTTLVNAGLAASTFSVTDGWMISGEDTDLVYGDAGIRDSPPSSFPWAGWTGRRGEGAFGVWAQGVPLDSPSVASLLSIASLSMVGDGTRHTLEPDDEIRLIRWFAMGPDTASLARERRLREGLAQVRITGETTDSEGNPVVGARVHLVGAAGVDSYATTDTTGAWEAWLPEGEYTAYAVGRDPGERVAPHVAGRYPPLGSAAQQAAQVARIEARTPALPFAVGYGVGVAAVSVVEGTDAPPIEHVLETPGRLTIQLRDDSGAQLSGVVDIRRIDADARPPEVPEGLFEALAIPDSPSRAAWLWSLDDTEIALPAGTYTVEAAHSHRHERATAEVTLGSGDAATIELMLAEVVAQDGWVAVDTHLHAAPSMDGSLAMEERVLVCAATGVDVPVMTDHDRMADYAPIVRAFGLRERVLSVPGVEVTPIVRGHFNLFPVDPDPEATNLGALRWWDRYPTSSGLHAAGRATAPEGAILQVNHGRNPLGMFDLAGWTPNRTSRPDAFTLDFDLMEIITTEDEGDWLRNRTDWFDLLDQGEIKVPSGASDSHERTHACGAGRTDLALSMPVADASPTDVRDALLGGQTVAASGVTLRVTLDGLGPGSTISGSRATLAITVQSPSWIRPDVVRIWKNGEVLEEHPLTEATGGLWFDQSIEVTTDDDAWFAVEVDGETPMGHIWGGATPYALANALFLDVP
jgi:hypothetical protein